jgi:hypothetical protein
MNGTTHIPSLEAARPVYQLLRGAWYPSFGKPDDGLGFGPEMVTHDHGSTGIAGISYYAADQFPEPYWIV